MKAISHKQKIFVGIMIFLYITLYSVSGREKSDCITLKLQSYVLGPLIKLGDVSSIKLKNNFLTNSLKQINLGKAAPPGEAKDLTRSYIRAKIRQSGFFEYVKFMDGPKIITVITIPNELRNMFVRESLAQNGESSQSLNMTNLKEI